MGGNTSEESRSDHELVEAANGGDVAAFERLYERYRDWAVDLAWRLTGDRELALDAMQESFVYLLRQFPGFTLRARMTTFLYPVVRHNAVALAEKKRRAAGAGEATRPDDEPARQTEPADGPRDEADLSALRCAVEALPPAHREVLLLRFADDASLQEIAIAVECPLGTVKTRLHHAIASLREDERLRNYFSD